MSSIGNFEKIRALHATPRFVVVAGARSLPLTELRIFDHAADKPLFAVKMPAAVHALAGNDVVVAAGCADGWVRVVDLASGALVSEHRLHDGPVHALAVAPADPSKGGAKIAAVIASAGADGFVRFTSLATGEAPVGLPRERSLSTRPLRAVAFDASGDVVFAAGDDGTVRALALRGSQAGSVRDMPGHDGPVLALAHLPRDGRLASGGDDGSIRLWYLSGDVEHEVKGNDQDAHKGPVTALVHVAAEPEPGQDAPDRLYSTSTDGTLKAWRLEDRKKPRTLDTGAPLAALAFAPKPGADHAAAERDRGAGTLFFGGDKRSLARAAVESGGQLGDSSTSYQHGFDEQAAELTGARPKREAAVSVLFGLLEREARDLLQRVASSDKEADVRALVVREAASRRRQDLRDAVKDALDDGDKAVRAAAFDALLALDADPAAQRGVLVAVRAAGKSKHADVRKRSLEKLVSLAGTSPLVPGLVAEKLVDADGTVRLAALASLVALDIAERKDPAVDALATAYARGTADVRTWVLVRAARGGLLAHPALAGLAARALDDEDADVRRTAFALRVLVEKTLAEKLETAPALAATEVGSSFKEALKRIAALESGDPALAAAVTDDDIGIARMVLPPAAAGTGDAFLAPLLVAMACRTPDTALRGALSLAVLGDGRALGALLQLSREGDAALRKGTVPGLFALGDDRAKKRLAWMLDDVDAAVRAAAYDALAKLDAGQPLLVADTALRSSFEDVRARGLELLIKAGKDTPQASLLLEEAIEDESAKVRAEAFRTLWSWHEAQPGGPQTAIERALDARFADTRMRAVEELAARAKADHKDVGWARQKLVDACGDVDGGVGKAAFEAAQKHLGDKALAPIQAALDSADAGVRALAAKAARKGPVDTLRSPLTRALLDDDVAVRTHALESLDVLVQADNGPLITALQGKHIDLRVRAAELLALRKDEQLIDTMRALLDDKDLARVVGPEAAAMLRRRAAGALATLGSKKNVKVLQALIRDTSTPQVDAATAALHVGVREEAARGLASSCRAGDEAVLLDAMGHSEVWVRSWAAEGLARLGDVRALPVLVGTLRHDHLPIRRGAILSFAAFGPEGYSGLLQGLEDKDEEIEQIVFAIVLAHDLQLLRRGRAPDFLATALSSQRAEVRFAAARALEMRVDGAVFLNHLVDVLTPPKPDKVSDMTPEKGWPVEEERTRILRGLAEALGADGADRRYAAAQALLHKKNPRDFFRIAADVARLRPSSQPVVPDTRPRPISIEGDPVDEPRPPRGTRGFFRRLFAGSASTPAAGAPSPSAAPAGAAVASIVTSTRADGVVVVAPVEQERLRRLAFGAYVGLLRQVVAGDESQRVRRDAVDRIVDLGKNGGLGVAASLPPLVRALDDAHHLVRKAALAGLKVLVGVDEAQRLGLASPYADVARAVLDELAAKGAAAKDDVARALSSENADVRKAAFELLEKLAPKDGPQALEPLLLALASPHADLRLGVLERLASSSDPRVVDALNKALGSDHDDLRLRAAELVARRGDPRAADVLGAFLRHDNAALANRARGALSTTKHPAAVRALAARIDEVSADGPAVIALVDAVARAGAPGPATAAMGATSAASATSTTSATSTSASTGTAATTATDDPAPAALAVLVRLFEHEREDVRAAAFNGGLVVTGPQKRNRRPALELGFLPAAARAKDPVLRRRAAEELDRTDDRAADELLLSLFTDRDATVRAAAVTSYATRVRRRGADVAPLLDVMHKGRRELVLPSAEGVATKNDPQALVPLLLVTRAGEPGERERALLALGTLGDPRALAELELIAGGGTAEAPAEPSMKVAATEALGRLYNRISDSDARARIWSHLDACAGERDAALVQAAVRGLIAVDDERARARIEAVLGETSLDTGTLVLAATALRLIGDVNNEAGLAQALRHYNLDVAMAAKRALERIFPNDKVKIALLSVASSLTDIAGPAAGFLAEEGDAADLLARLPELKNDDLRERVRFGLLRRGLLPPAGIGALLEDDRVRARANGAFLAGAHAKTFTVDGRSAILRSLVRAEEKSAAGFGNANPQDKNNELSTWLRVWVAARRFAATGADGSLREIAKRRMQAAPAPVRAAAVRYLATSTGTPGDGAAAALQQSFGDTDGAVRQAAATALRDRVPEVTKSLRGTPASLAAADPIALAITLETPLLPNEREALVATSAGRAALLPSLWRNKDAGALLDRAREGDRGAVDALAFVDHDIVRASLYELAGDEELAEDLRKAAYRALRRNNRRKAALDKKLSSPISLAAASTVTGAPAAAATAPPDDEPDEDDDDGDDDDDDDDGEGDDE